MSVETVVEGAVAEVKSVAEAVVAEAAKVEEAVKAALVQITADEKLFLREAELEFLKAQMEIQRLTKLAEEKSKAYTAYIEQLFVKYGITKVEYVFDGAVNSFKKL
jgi:hypothetical protein